MKQLWWTGRVVPLVAFGSLVLGPGVAAADIAHFQLDGKLYNKFLYSNDATQGTVWLGNPAPGGDNFSGGNGATTEFELGIRAKVSKYVTAGVRLQSRWGAVWQDWWENGDLALDENGQAINPPVGDTSGESLGMNHAQYIKLRGYYIEVAPPIKTVKSVRVGTSDLGMFSPWTIGKIRYIDRDNAKGSFVRGKLDSLPLGYEAAVIALPKLFVGPGWNIGNGDGAVSNAFITQDWAYAAKLTSTPVSGLNLTGIGSFTNDYEFNLNDPDMDGTTNPLGQEDGAIDWDSRFRSFNGTLEVDSNQLSNVRINALAGFSWNSVNPTYTYNLASSGFTPVVYDESSKGYAGKVRVEATDPFGIGLSINAEYFNIGEHWNSIFGSRREADVLLTDGFMEGGQLPTLNIANEFQDWDESWFETCIGWHGLTIQPVMNLGVSEIKGEFTYLTYNTNGQNRDMETIYPGFLYGSGFTDTDFYDYANVGDRGRDLRSAYHQHMDRSTQIMALWYNTVLDVGKGIDLKTKFKYIHDTDTVEAGRTDDDYVGNIFSLRLRADYQLSSEMRGFVGDEINHWRELNRAYTANSINDYITRKNKLFAGFEYNFGSIKLTYLAEWILKDQSRETLLNDEMPFAPGDLIPHPFTSGNYSVANRLRTKATLEAAW